MEALSNPKYKFVPYRESKLTRMLQETLSKHSSKSKIVWIANIGPADISTDDTIRTLRVAKRLKRRNLP